MKLRMAITRHAHQHPHQLLPVPLEEDRSLRILPHLKWSVAHELISELFDWGGLAASFNHNTTIHTTARYFYPSLHSPAPPWPIAGFSASSCSAMSSCIAIAAPRDNKLPFRIL